MFAEYHADAATNVRLERRSAIFARHVGIIYERNPILHPQPGFEFWVLSQWGEDGEYLHRLADVPVLLGNQVEYWSDRR